MNNIDVGDEVVAIRDGGQDLDGFPKIRPITLMTYKITSIYAMKYGLGCTLEGMDPAPYKGYLLYVIDGSKLTKQRGWYFEKVRRIPV